MRFGLTTGFGDPLGSLLDDLSAKGVEVGRQSLRPDSNIEACVTDFVGRAMRPLFLLPRLAQVSTQMRPLLTLAVEHLGAGGADVGVGNESNIHDETVAQALAAVAETQAIADDVRFEGAIYATSISNLEPVRDFGWMRALWPRLSIEVVRDFHRYPEKLKPGALDDRHPWHQFQSLDAECEAVLAEAKGGPVSITEFAHSTVISRGWSFGPWHPFDGQVTDEQSADYLTEDLLLYARFSFKDAMVYQINNGTDPFDWGACQGIRAPNPDGSWRWLPQAECFARARAQLGTT